jgi:glycosyltransferase involved in cell wall biosynthesis
MKVMLSIIVPIYNVETYLFKCLYSITNQGSKNFEVILVDDGSTDRSKDLAVRFADNDQRFKYYLKQNGGLSDARNFGIDHSNGEYLAFVDGDDYIASNFVELMLHKQQETQAKIVVCDMIYVHETNQRFSSGGDFDVVNIQENLQYLSINNSACNKIYHRDLFRKNRFPKGKLYEDLFIVPILLFEANRVAHVKESLYFYVQRGGSIVHQINPKMFDIYDAITHLSEELKNKVKEPEILEKLINHMYIEHGLMLTTLRIKDAVDIKNQAHYFKQNIEKLDACYPNWRNDDRLKQYSMKQRIIFTLMSWGLFNPVSYLFRKRTS